MLVLVQRPQHKGTPDPVAAPKNIPFGTIFIEFGDTKRCCTFSGLELAPKSRKKLIGALSCMHKGPKCIQSLWDHPKKFLLCKSTKKVRYVRSLGKKPHFGPSQRLKKVLLTAQGCARLRTGLIITQIPRGYQKKSLLCRKARYVRSLAKKTHFWPSQRLKKVLFTAQGCARLRTGLIITQIPRGYQKKSLLCRKARYVRSLAKKPHFWPSQRLKKVLFTAQGCARLRTGLIVLSNLAILKGAALFQGLN